VKEYKKMNREASQKTDEDVKCCEHDPVAICECGVPYICHIKFVGDVVIGRCCFCVFKMFRTY